jgi:HAE1 family hydrophobic/amphiphilic exporter-1
VSRIELGALSYNQSGRFNGRPAALLPVYPTPGANALTVADGVKAMMEELKERFPSDLDYQIGLDTTLPVTEGMKEIATTLVEAMILVILWCSCSSELARDPHPDAVPVSLISTFAFFPFLGFSINTLSLFGLVLAIGLVVDDDRGGGGRSSTTSKGPVRAMRPKAMSEVSGPVVGIALVLSSVFIPIGLMGGSGPPQQAVRG